MKKKIFIVTLSCAQKSGIATSIQRLIRSQNDDTGERMHRFRYLIFCANLFSSIAFSFQAGHIWGQTAGNDTQTYYPPTSSYPQTPQATNSYELLSVLHQNDAELPFNSFEVVLVGPKEGKNPYAKWKNYGKVLFYFKDEISMEVAVIVHQARRANQQLSLLAKCRGTTISNASDLQNCLHLGAPNPKQTWIVLAQCTFKKDSLSFTYQGQNFIWNFLDKEQQLAALAIIENGKKEHRHVLLNTVVIRPEYTQFLPINHLIKLAE